MSFYTTYLTHQLILFIGWAEQGEWEGEEEGLFSSMDTIGGTSSAMSDMACIEARR
jgi:hypothetical protein